MADFSHLTATEFLNSENGQEARQQFNENIKNSSNKTIAYAFLASIGKCAGLSAPCDPNEYKKRGLNLEIKDVFYNSIYKFPYCLYQGGTADDILTELFGGNTEDWSLKQIFKTAEESRFFNTAYKVNPDKKRGDRDIKIIYRVAREAFGVDMEYVSMMSFLKDGLNRGIKQFILHGAPGTGKTWAAEQFAKNNADNNRIRTVQFHPSYDYTDFIDGLRPIKLPGDNNPTFVRMDGVFKEFCREALKDKENKYFFLIDEINRADLSRVFGELMYCMNNPQRSDSEEKKRRIFGPYDNLTTYGKNCEPLTDDAFAEGFFIPENVIIIGTMNDIDKSVDSIDFALRRRFVWKKASAEGEANIALENYWKEKPERVKSCFERIKAVNAVIGGEPGKFLGLSEDYYIGHAYFMQGKAKKDEKEAFASDEEFFASVWHYSIKPVLESYCFGRDGEAFVGACKNKYFETGMSDAEVEQ